MRELAALALVSFGLVSLAGFMLLGCWIGYALADVGGFLVGMLLGSGVGSVAYGWAFNASLKIEGLV